MTTQTYLIVPQNYHQVETHLLKVLQRAGFEVHQAFRLSEARQQTGMVCQCPQHGTDTCQCEWCTFLVYDKARRWVATLTLYGHEAQTRITCRCDPRHQAHFEPVLEVFTTRVTLPKS